MRRYALIVMLALLAVAGCSWQSSPASQARYHLTLPSGRHVVAAHSRTFGLPPKGVRAVRPSFAATGLMLDTVGVSEMNGLNPGAVAGYTSGHWPTFGGLVAAFPHAVHVPVAVNKDAPSFAPRTCLDVEPGDATADQAGGWAVLQIMLHRTPCLYASLSNMGSVTSSLRGAGLSRSQYQLWDADWTRVYHLDSGFDCTQWDDTYQGRNIDPSACTLAFLGVKPPPPPDPYRFYDKARFRLQFGVLASEYTTVKTWDRFGCENPVRRPTCKSTLFHLRLLRDRAIFVAHHQVVKGRWVALKKPRYEYAHLGARIHGLQARITAAPGHACSVGRCG